MAHVSERKFLGHGLLGDGTPTIAPQTLERMKDRVRAITRRNRGVLFERMVGELNSFLSGWVTYLPYAKCQTHLAKPDGWVRTKLRCVRLKQRKRAKSIAEFRPGLGVPKNRSWTTAVWGKGWWRTRSEERRVGKECRL